MIAATIALNFDRTDRTKWNPFLKLSHHIRFARLKVAMPLISAAKAHRLFTFWAIEFPLRNAVCFHHAITALGWTKSYKGIRFLYLLIFKPAKFFEYLGLIFKQTFDFCFGCFWLTTSKTAKFVELSWLNEQFKTFLRTLSTESMTAIKFESWFALLLTYFVSIADFTQLVGYQYLLF